MENLEELKTVPTATKHKIKMSSKKSHDISMISVWVFQWLSGCGSLCSEYLVNIQEKSLSLSIG